MRSQDATATFFVPQDEIKDIQVNQKVIYHDASAVEDEDFFDENPPPAPEEQSDAEPKETADVNQRTETLQFSDVYATEVVGRRTSVRRSTPFGRYRLALTRTQHALLEIDEDHDEQKPCTLVPEVEQNYEKDNPVVSEKNTSRTTDSAPRTNNLTRASWSIGTRYILRANPTPEMYSGFLIHQLSDTRAALRPVSTQGQGTEAETSQSRTSSVNIHCSEQATNIQVSPQQNASKNISFLPITGLFSRLRRKFENGQHPQHTHSARTRTSVGDKRTHKKVSFLLTTQLTAKLFFIDFQPLKTNFPCSTYYTLSKPYKNTTVT